jgi:radical SAM superfamily enzyme YgiQ (UPF0313 family)
MKEHKFVILVNIKYPTKTIEFPTGLAYIAQALVRAGIEFEVIDLIPILPEEREKFFLKSISGLRNCIFGFGVIIGNRCLEINTHYANIVRKHCPDSSIVFGGPLATAAPELLLQNEICDYVVMGEGEERFVSLINGLNSGKISTAPGIFAKQNSYRQDALDTSDLTTNKKIQMIKNIDDYAPPAYEYFDMDFYKDFYETHGLCFPLNASRGCRANCKFCFRFTGQGFHARRAHSIANEISYIHKKYKFNKFIFLEENFVQNKVLVQNFINLTFEYNFAFRCVSRVDDLTEEIIKELADSNFLSIGFGVESVNQKTLDLLNKGTSVRDIVEKMEILRKYGIEPRCSFILGFPDDTEQDFIATYKFIKEHQIHGTVNLFTPLPRTKIFKENMDLVLKKTNTNSVWEYIKLIDRAFLFQDLVVNLTKYPDEILMHYKKLCTDLARQSLTPKGKYKKFIRPYNDKLIR